MLGECYYCPDPAREDSLRCEGCAQRADDRILAKNQLPEPSISIFEAIDIKHNYIVSVLSKVFLPSSDALFIDSEMHKIGDSNTASNIFEYTAYSKDPKAESGQWLTLRAKAGKVPESTLAKWALEIEKWLGDKLVVAYGTAKPELHRIHKLQAYLPQNRQPTNFKYFDVQQDIVRRLFSYNPSDELDPTKPIYLPFFGLEYIGKHLNKTAEKDSIYAEDWVWPTLSTHCSIRGKSVYDVSMMYNLVHALQYAKAGNYFTAKHQPNVKGKGKRKALEAPQVSVTQPLTAPTPASRGNTPQKKVKINHFFAPRPSKK